MDDTVGMLFLKEKQAKIIMALYDQSREWHIADLAGEAGATYVHTSKFIGICEEHGIVASEKHGRTKKLLLTKKGEEIAKNVAGILQGIAPEVPATEQPQK